MKGEKSTNSFSSVNFQCRKSDPILTENIRLEEQDLLRNLVFETRYLLKMRLIFDDLFESQPKSKQKVM